MTPMFPAAALAFSILAACAQPGPASAPAAPPAGPAAPLKPSDRFPTLDAYLAHLQQRSHVGGAWYREVSPGRFELQTGRFRPSDEAPAKRVFTREELERKFGFGS